MDFRRSVYGRNAVDGTETGSLWNRSWGGREMQVCRLQKPERKASDKESGVHFSGREESV